MEGEGGRRGGDLRSAGREAQLSRKKGDRQRGGQKGTEIGRSWRCWNRGRGRGPRKRGERGVEGAWGQAGMRVVVDEPGKSWVVESCDGGVGPGRQGEQGKGWRIGKEWRETGNSVETEKGRLRRWVARTGSCAWGQGGVVDMAGVHCSLFVVVRVSLFVALIFSDPLLPLSASTAVRRFSLSPSLVSPPPFVSFVFFVRSCVSAFRYLPSCLSSTASLIPVHPLLSPCVSLFASFSLLFPLWLALTSGFFLFPSLPRRFLHPSSFPPSWRNLLVFHSSCLFISLFLSSVSILLHPLGGTGVEEVVWREVDGEVRNVEGHGGVEGVSLGGMSGARVKGGRGETLFDPFSLLIRLFLGRFTTPGFPFPGRVPHLLLSPSSSSTPLSPLYLIFCICVSLATTTCCLRLCTISPILFIHRPTSVCTPSLPTLLVYFLLSFFLFQSCPCSSSCATLSGTLPNS